jgi:hypothetical protein
LVYSNKRCYFAILYCFFEQKGSFESWIALTFATPKTDDFEYWQGGSKRPECFHKDCG